MKRRDLMKRRGEIGKAKDAVVTTREGGQHTVVLFDGRSVTTVPRHREVNEYTANGAMRAAEKWEKEE